MYDQSSTEANLATSQVVNVKNEALFLLLYELQQLHNLKKIDWVNGCQLMSPEREKRTVVDQYKFPECYGLQ